MLVISKDKLPAQPEPELEQTTTVLFKWDSRDTAVDDRLAFPVGHSLLVQTTFPIDPDKPAPVFYDAYSGVKCDLIPVAYTKDGKADLHQLVCLHTLSLDDIVDEYTGQATFTTKPTLPKRDTGPLWLGTDLGEMEVTIPTPVGVTFTAKFRDAQKIKTWRNGNFVNETEWWGRSEGPNGELGPGVRWFIDRRADETIWVTIKPENTLFNPTKANLTQPDPTATGPLHFSSIDIQHNTPGLWLVYADGYAPSMRLDGNGGSLVRAENICGGSGPEQLLAAGHEDIFHFVLRSARSNTIKAKSVGAYVGYGIAKSGDYAVGKRRGYGVARYYGMDHTGSRVAHKHGTSVGRKNCITRDRKYTQTILQQITTGGRGNGFDIPSIGRFHPFSASNPIAAGQFQVELLPTGSYMGFAYRGYQARHRATMQRHPSGLVHAVTGKQVTIEDLVAANGNGKMPWNMVYRAADSQSEGWNNEPPCNLRASYYDAKLKHLYSNDIRRERALCYEGHPWNRPTTCSGEQARPMYASDIIEFGQHAGYRKYEGNHHARMTGTLEPLVWGANRGWAKHELAKEANYAKLRYSHVPLDMDGALGRMHGPYFLALGNMPHAIALCSRPGKAHMAGSGGRAMNRGDGMMLHLIAAGLRLAAPGDPVRESYGEWVGVLADLYDLVSNDYGVTTRTDANDYLANQPLATGYALLAYPASTYALGSTAFPLDTAIKALPNQHGVPRTPGAHWSHVQGFQICYCGYGVTDHLLAGVPTNTPEWNKLAKSVEFINSMYTHGRVPGESRPPSHTIVSQGSNGVLDPPGTGQPRNPDGTTRAVPWKFEQVAFTDPKAGGAPIRFTPDLNFRSLILMAQSTLVAQEAGNLALVGRLVRFLKEFAGAPTVQQATYSLFAGYNGEEAAYPPYFYEFMRCEYGAAIDVLEGVAAQHNLQ